MAKQLDLYNIANAIADCIQAGIDITITKDGAVKITLGFSGSDAEILYHVADVRRIEHGAQMRDRDLLQSLLHILP